MLMNKTDSNSDAKAYNPHRVAAVINFWGAVFDTAWLKNANVPIVSVHGRKDRIVPYIRNGNSLWKFCHSSKSRFPQHSKPLKNI